MKWTIEPRRSLSLFIHLFTQCLFPCSEIHLHAAACHFAYVIARKKINSLNSHTSIVEGKVSVFFFLRQPCYFFCHFLYWIFFFNGKIRNKNTLIVLMKINRTHFIELVLIAFVVTFFSLLKQLDWIKIRKLNR